jgi:beta-phosphoglucomutase
MYDIKGLIFDLDGVLVDTAKYHFLAWKRLAKEIGIDFSKEDNEKLKGISRKESLDIILAFGNKDLSLAQREELMAKKNDWYLEFINLMDPSEILPGVLSFINDSKKNGYKIALGSASKNALLILQILDIGQLFDVIIDGNISSNSKPNPEVFLKGAEGLGLKSSECIVFEDAVAGIEAGLNAGMICIGIGNPEVLKDAHLVFDGFKNLDLEKDIIDKI